MSVEFVVRASDLRQAVNELKANRGAQGKDDFVDILVSEVVATFRSVGTETEIPVNGKQPGSVRLPLRCVDSAKRVLPSFKKSELTILCEPGSLKIGTWSLRHPDIELGAIPDQRLQIPVDVSVLDTFALAHFLGPERVAEEGMRPRVEAAIQVRQSAVSGATQALQPLGTTESQIQRMVEAHIDDAAGRLKRVLSRD